MNDNRVKNHMGSSASDRPEGGSTRQPRVKPWGRGGERATRSPERAQPRAYGGTLPRLRPFRAARSPHPVASPGLRPGLSSRAPSGPSIRPGFSLLEVLLATAILFGSAIVLFELAAIGREHVNSTEELAIAQRICETRINEILAGVESPRSVENEELLEQPGWKLSVEVNPVDQQPGLAALRVTVFREPGEKRRGKQFTLVRWIRDPDQNGSASSPPDVPMPFGSSPLEPGAGP